VKIADEVTSDSSSIYGSGAAPDGVSEQQTFLQYFFKKYPDGADGAAAKNGMKLA